jgi:RNA polymerase sigma-70 factor, ECF subfamily
MSRARADAQGAAGSTGDASAPGPIIDLVSTTGARGPAELIYRSADLDETAFAPDDPTTARVYGLAVRIAPSPPRAEEALSDSCGEVWRTSTRFDADRSSAIAWIMAIAHRRAVDRLRSARDTTAPPPVTPIRSLGRRARRHAHQDRHSRHVLAPHVEAAQVREALLRLDPEHRESLELAYLDTYSAAPSADLATIMSTIVNTRLPHEPVGPEGLDRHTSPSWPPDLEAS